MKAILPLILLSFFISTTVVAQIKIGDNPQNIDPSSVLELESTSKVLVITRVTTDQMNAIVPSRGALVYNTNANCIHYYDGTAWINLCDAVSFTITNEPIVNSRSTISVTESPQGYNLEVAQNSIRSENIVDGGINGDDIQDNSIGESKLGENSVGSSELRQNSVGSDEIRDGSIVPTDIANFIPDQVMTTDENGIVQWEDSGNLKGAVGDEITITGAGTTANPLAVTEEIQLNIVSNTTTIADHIINDQDIDDSNELTDLNYDTTNNILSLTNSLNGSTVDLSGLNNAGSDNQTLSLNGDILAITGGNQVTLPADNDNQELDINGNIITITGGNQITLPPGTVNTDNQELSLNGNTLAITGGNQVTLPADNDNQELSINGNRISLTDGGFVDIPEGAAEIDGDIRNELQDLAFDPGTNILTLTTPNTPGNQADLSSLAGGGATDGVITNVTLNGTDLVFTGTAPGFVGTIPLASLSGNSGITTLTDGTILVGFTGDVPTERSISGDATMNNLGELTIEAGAVSLANIEPLTPAPAEDQMLITNTAGTVAWSPINTTAVADGTTITGIGTTLNPFTIEPSTTNGQYLRTDATGTVIWDNLPTGTAGTVSTDGITITGDGLATDIQVPTGGITTTQILDETVGSNDIAADAITTEKLAPGTAADQLLQFDGTDWVLINETDINSSIATIVSGDADNAITTSAIDGGAFYDDTALTTVTAANTAAIAAKEDAANKSTDGTLADNSDDDFPTEQAVKTYVDTQVGAITAPTIVSADADNAIMASAIDGGAFYDDTSLTTVTAANTAAIAAKEDAANKSTDGTLADNSDDDFPTEQAVKTYVDTQVGSITAPTIVSADADNAITASAIDGGAFYDDTALTTVTAANTAAIAAKEDAANKSTDGTLADNSDDDFPTEQAVKTYVDTQVGAITAPTIVSADADNAITASAIDGGAFYDDTALTTVTAANTAAIARKEDAANKSTDGTLADNSDDDFPTEQAVKTYVDTQVGAITAPTIVSADADNAIMASAIDGGAFYDDTALTTVTAANTAAIAAKEDAANKSTDGTLADNSDDDFPTEQAVKTYVDTQVGSITAPTIVSADADNAITASAIDGGAFYDDTALTTVTAANTAAIAAKEDAANKSTDGTLADNSDDDFPTEQAVKTYVDTQVGAITAGDNSFNTNLTLTENRSHQLAGFNFNFDGSGNIGIGNNNPQNKLHVSGEVRSQGYSNSNGTPNEPAYSFTNDIDTGMFRGVSGGGNAPVNWLRFATGGNEAITIDPNQNVGIGTINPNGKLHVVGTSRFDGDVFVNGTQVIPDYVFQKYFLGKSLLKATYEMMSLSDVENFIKLNHHLPDVPSYLEIKEQGGIIINKTTLTNLEKIEELFLHTIEQEKKIKDLEATNEAMQYEVQSLKLQMEEIKKMLDKTQN